MSASRPPAFSFFPLYRSSTTIKSTSYVVCVAGDAPGARFRVKDVIRPAGTVLEVTPLQDGEESAPIRVHTSGKGPASAADVMAPWLGPALEASDAHCLRLRLATDPWIVGSNVVPSGGPEEVSVEVVAP